MQKWEYRTVTRRRGWKTAGLNKSWFEATNWDEPMTTLLTELGDAGWELVSVTSGSSVLGALKANMSEMKMGAVSRSDSVDFAGFTDTEQWIFKRPK